MSNDLEAFLRQAAERRKQKQDAKKQPGVSPSPSNLPNSAQTTGGRSTPSQGASNQPPVSRSVPNRPVDRRNAKAEFLEPILLTPEIVDDLVNKKLPKQPRRSNVPAERHLAQGISQADEKVEAHIKAVFEHRVGHLSKSNAASRLANLDVDNTGSSEDPVSRRTLSNDAVSELLDMLRDPQSLKAAFIASEIFKKKF